MPAGFSALRQSAPGTTPSPSAARGAHLTEPEDDIDVAIAMSLSAARAVGPSDEAAADIDAAIALSLAADDPPPRRDDVVIVDSDEEMPQAPWTCGICTLRNNALALMCSVCGHERM